MSASILSLAIEWCLCLGLIHPPALLLQSPGFHGGKLVIQSEPHAGAKIFINNKSTNRQTNSTFVVSAGTYWVAVTGGPDNLNCGGQAGEAQVTDASTVVLICTAKGFERK